MATRLKTALLKDKDNTVIYPKTTANEVIIDYGDSTTLKERLNISAGSPNQPVYFDGTGKPIPILYSIRANVPSNAAFTDRCVDQYHTTVEDQYRPILLGANYGLTAGEVPSNDVEGEHTFFNRNIVASADLGDITAISFTGQLNGNADTATALTSSAGSATQPIYFKNGRPVATTYTLGKSVPANAVFTDTIPTAEDIEIAQYLGGTVLGSNTLSDFIYDAENELYNIYQELDTKVTTDTTYVVAAGGLTGGGSANSSTGVALNVGQGAGIIVEPDAVKVALTSDTKLAYDATTVHTPTSTTVQPVRLDASGKLAVVMPNMTAATASAAGSKGLVPAPAAGKQSSFLRGDGTWATPTDTNTTKVTAGNGLTGGGSAASGTGVTLNVGAGVGITVAADAVKAKLRSETALTVDSAAATTTSGRVYPVAVDKTGYLAVNVPWTDTNTHYTTKLFATSSSGTAHAATTNGGTYLRLFDDSTARQSIKIVGSGATTVTSDANGVITINSTDTNTNTNYYHTRSYSSGLQISTGTGVSNMYVPYATASQYGVVKPNAVRTSAITASNGGTTSGRYYGVEMDSNGKLFVNVPWTDTNTDTNTDTLVKQTATTSSTKYPVLMSASNSPTSGSAYEARYNTSVTIGSSVLYGAAWNDYAEYRETKETIEPGRVICENGDDTLSLATERMQPGASVVSDTFGFTIGETEKAKTPIAVSGRVLVYPYEDRYSYKPGDAVCAAPNGTVSKMTREEIREYPERIVGTVSAIPEYETWGEDNVPVNGRIWIKVK